MNLSTTCESDFWNEEKVNEIISECVHKVFDEFKLNFDEEDAEICFLFTTDNEIKELNKTFRGVDKATNVLSFPAYAPDDIPLGDNKHRTHYKDECDEFLEAHAGEMNEECCNSEGRKQHCHHKHDEEHCCGKHDGHCHKHDEEHCCGKHDGHCHNHDKEHCCGKHDGHCHNHDEYDEDFYLSEENEPCILGSVAVAYETVERESKEQEKSFDDHLKHLIIHSLLHLFGYDHISDEEAKVMESLEIKILKKMNIDNPYK